MDQAKKEKKVKYWISYRLPNDRQRRESVDAIEDLNGYSIEDARDAFSKKRVSENVLEVKKSLDELNTILKLIRDETYKIRENTA